MVAPATVVVVVATGWVPLSTCSRATMVEHGGFGSDTLSGTNPTVISWRLTNLRSAGLTVVRPPVCSTGRSSVWVDSTHERASTSPTLPASGVPAAHFSPFLYSGTEADGYFSEVLVSVRPSYPSANLPSVALFPASLAVFGAMRRTPLPVVVRPVVAVVGEAARAGSVVPQMSKARPACHVVPTVGSTTVGVLL